ncbi:MAG: MBL fold metallo-hydrolase [Arcticibacter sp.]
MEGRLPIEKTPKGLYFGPGDFHLDPKRGADRAVVSHGHADHALPSNREVWCTPATAAIMQARYGSKLKSIIHAVELEQPFQINGIKLSFHSAGHMLGSAQTLIEHDGIRYCYTGDFKTTHDPSCEPFKPVRCDVLITETTFADPDYDHPNDSDELNRLEAWTDYTWVVGAYSLGKSQRITRLLTERFPNRKVMVHPEPAVFHRIYEDYGMALGQWEHYDHHAFKRTNDLILMVPPKVLSSFHGRPGIVTMFATGWKRPYIRATHHMQISDHADWGELLRLIESSGATTIMAVHGSGIELQNHLQKISPNINVIL